MSSLNEENPNSNMKIGDDYFDTISISSSKRISDELFDKLRNAIISGELPEGYTFPNENDLCKKLDIGRSSLREAYAPLEALHLIRRTKSGTYVNKSSITKNSMNFDVIAQYTDPINMIEYRQIYEVGVVRLAAQKAQSKDITVLTKIVDQMERYEKDTQMLTELDFQFHSHLAKMTGNELLMISFTTIRLIYEKFVKEQFDKHMLDQSVYDHRALIQALKRKDPDKAEQLMREHIAHIEKVARTKKTDK